jgi:hypothetical protein
MDGLNENWKSSSVFLSLEAGLLDAAFDLPMPAHRHFITEHQFQKLGVIELVSGSLLQPHIQRLGQAAQSQLS